MRLTDTVIVSHDAGGAFLLSKWCRDWRARCNFKYCLKGPAIDIFNAVIPDIKMVDEIPWERVNRVITSTGWQTDLEVSAIKEAKNKGVSVASYLDHWVNYQSRFEVDDKLYIPDELWLADKEAMVAAQKIFSVHSVEYRYVRNRHFSELRSAILNSRLNKYAILICLEPIRNGYSIHQAYSDLISYLLMNYPEGKNIIIRDHPSKSETFSHILFEGLSSKFKIKSSQSSLDQDMAQAEAVYGYQSSVLAYASMLNLPVFSFYPKDKYPIMLPHENIQYI